MTSADAAFEIASVTADEADFRAVRARVGYALADEPVDAGGACFVARVGGAPLARLACWTRERVVGLDGAVGMIGHYEALDAAAGAALLRHAAAALRTRGARTVLGPIDGSTWRRYRLPLPPATQEEHAPPFLGEPLAPAAYVAHFRAAGFGEIARYESRLVRLDGAPLSAGSPAADSTRPVRLDRWDEELEMLHALSLRAFAGNAFYTPIDIACFRSLYAPLRDRVDPELVRVAERGGVPAAFVFAYADPFAAAAPHGPRIVLKTLATDPAHRGVGLGSLLTAAVGDVARARGARGVVHALMHVDNASVGISGRHESVSLRRYAIFAHGADG